MSDALGALVGRDEVRLGVERALELAAVKAPVARSDDEQGAFGPLDHHGLGDSRGLDADLAGGELDRRARAREAADAVGKASLGEPGGGAFK